ncbi:glycosyl hydrolase family 18 protein [Streptomyces sp. NPDC002164]|uniref:glycosyl hydrolase family 18 protein n=1 Tax=Streptomyces sp. NPDC002164 TaxID=3364633 RepID=UPI0036CF4F50
MSELVNASDPGIEVNGEVLGKGAAEKTYQENGFDPSREDSRLSYTPRRAAKTVFNTYQGGNGLALSGYVASDSAYDSRLDGDFSQGGQGADIARIPAGAFDELVIGGVGIVGDQGERKDQIDRAAQDFKLGTDSGQATFTDSWGDVLAYIGYGFDGYLGDDAAANFTQDKAHGLLGAVAGLKKKNPNLKIGLNIGGWEMSEAFHHIAKDAASRERFADSLARIFTAFPMLTAVHLDWQYPNSAGAASNEYGLEDTQNYAELIKAVKQKLPQATIAITAPADTDEIKAMNIPLLIDAGAQRIDLLAFDSFGTLWAPALDHHTPLRHASGTQEPRSADAAVTYLVDEQRVAPGVIHLAYATHTRNARQAKVQQTSPLKGTYDPSADTTVGSFESGKSELADVLRNYLDLQAGKGRSGFTLCTDTAADADFLHNPDNGVFISLDTPRTVKAKAEYARAKNLGGLYAYRADGDTGLLANAAREGLGHTATTTVIDMKPHCPRRAGRMARRPAPRRTPVRHGLRPWRLDPQGHHPSRAAARRRRRRPDRLHLRRHHPSRSPPHRPGLAGPLRGHRGRGPGARDGGRRRGGNHHHLRRWGTAREASRTGLPPPRGCCGRSGCR